MLNLRNHRQCPAGGFSFSGRENTRQSGRQRFRALADLCFANGRCGGCAESKHRI